MTFETFVILYLIRNETKKWCRLLGVSLSTAGGTCELYGADNGVLSVNELETFEVEVADLEGLAKAE